MKDASPTMTLEKLFEVVVSYSKRYRSKYRDDFNRPWENISDLVSKYDRPFSQWNRDVLPNGVIHATFTNKALDLPEKVTNGRGYEELIELNHFMISIFRIPTKEPPTLGNLLQIAHYIGLVSAKLCRQDFPEGFVKNLKDLGCFKLLTFIGSEDHHALDSVITDGVIKEFQDRLRTLLKTMETM